MYTEIEDIYNKTGNGGLRKSLLNSILSRYIESSVRSKSVETKIIYISFEDFLFQGRVVKMENEFSAYVEATMPNNTGTWLNLGTAGFYLPLTIHTVAKISENKIVYKSTETSVLYRMAENIVEDAFIGGPKPVTCSMRFDSQKGDIDDGYFHSVITYKEHGVTIREWVKNPDITGKQEPTIKPKVQNPLTADGTVYNPQVNKPKKEFQMPRGHTSNGIKWNVKPTKK